jgi:hypothetical protein
MVRVVWDPGSGMLVLVLTCLAARRVDLDSSAQLARLIERLRFVRDLGPPRDLKDAVPQQVFRHLGQPQAITLLDHDRLVLIQTLALDHGLSLCLIA